MNQRWNFGLKNDLCPHKLRFLRTIISHSKYEGVELFTEKIQNAFNCHFVKFRLFSKKKNYIAYHVIYSVGTLTVQWKPALRTPA